jgi:serine/threonine-protein kinase
MNTASTLIEQRWAELVPLFDHAGTLDDAARRCFVDRIGDAQLRVALEALLAGAQSGGALDTDSGHYAARLLDPVPGLEGRRLGAWRVGHAIGSGGMATVFAATRADGAFDQQVAIKILRHGLHDAYERERFMRERALLARLEHPGIARVLDGGLTEEGVPWFALEYVDGQAVTRHCDAQRLDVDARLRLFEGLCAAVDHAHRNLIVHRDLKPSNVLVTRNGTFKLLDFGIAKLLDAGERDDDTRTGLRRLTPAYAAPEQVSGGTVTTATDVYALGVLLHELLTGVRPQRRDDGSLRTPSTLVTGEGAKSIAAARATTPQHLRRRLAGELDLILAKSLATDPVQRYAGAAALADDLARHRTGLPVLARPDAAGYRMRKFVGRHRRSLGVAAVLLLSLLAGVAATLWQARAARLEASRADAARDFVLSLFNGVTPDEARGRSVSARELLDRGATRLAETLHEQPQLHAELASQLGAAYRQLGAYDRSVELSEQARDAADGDEQRARALFELGRTRAAQGAVEDAERILREALAIAAEPLRSDVRLRLAEVASERGDKSALAMAEQALGDARAEASPDSTSRALMVVGGIHFHESRLDQAAAVLTEALALRRVRWGETHTLTAQAEHDLGVIVLQQGETAAAVTLFEQALATRRALLGAEHPDVADSQFNLGTALRRQGDNQRAATLITGAVTMQRKLLGNAHPLVANGLNSLALLAYGQGDTATAIDRLGEALVVARAAYGHHHPSVVAMLNNLAAMQRSAGRYADAEATARDAVTVAMAGPGKTHYLTGVARLGLGSVLAERGELAAAVLELRAAHALLVAALGAEHQDTLLAQAALADALREDGRLDEAQTNAVAALAAAPRAYPAGHPRLGKLRLVAARVTAARGDCATALPELVIAADELAKGGAAMRGDLAWATLERARCLRLQGDAATADALQAEARRSVAALPHAPPALLRATAPLD